MTTHPTNPRFAATEALLRQVSLSVRQDRRRLLELVSRAQGIDRATRRRVHDDLRRALERLRSATDKIRYSLGSAPIRGARLPAPQRAVAAVGRGSRGPASGRTTSKAPAAVSPSALQSLARANDANTQRGFRGIAENARAIDALAREQRQLVALQQKTAGLVAELAARGDVALLSALLVHHRKATKAGGTKGRPPGRVKPRRIRGGLDRSLESIRRKLGVLAEPTTAQALNNAATTMQVAAFGVSRNPLNKNNLAIAGNHLLWSSSSEFPRKLGLRGAARQAEWIVPLVGPLASLATTSAALGEAPQERFITGISTFSQETSVSLRQFIASSLWEEFRARTDVPVILTLLLPPDAPPSPAPAVLAGSVVRGSLALRVSGITDEVSVSWMVDTAPPPK